MGTCRVRQRPSRQPTRCCTPCTAPSVCGGQVHNPGLPRATRAPDLQMPQRCAPASDNFGAVRRTQSQEARDRHSQSYNMRVWLAQCTVHVACGRSGRVVGPRPQRRMQRAANKQGQRNPIGSGIQGCVSHTAPPPQTTSSLQACGTDTGVQRVVDGPQDSLVREWQVVTRGARSACTRSSSNDPHAPHTIVRRAPARTTPGMVSIDTVVAPQHLT